MISLAVGVTAETAMVWNRFKLPTFRWKATFDKKPTDCSPAGARGASAETPTAQDIRLIGGLRACVRSCGRLRDILTKGVRGR